MNNVREEYIQCKRLPSGVLEFKYPKGYKEEGVRYILEYEYLGCTFHHTYHPFWDAPKSDPNAQSCRMIILDFNK